MTPNLLWLLLLIVCVTLAGTPPYVSGVDGFVTNDIRAVVAGAIVVVDGLANGLHREAVAGSATPGWMLPP